MKRLGLVFAFLLALAGSVSAVSIESVYVVGTVYNADYTQEIAGANVKAVCNGVERTAVSDSSGDYFILYNSTDCNEDSIVTVTASKNGASGTASDKVKKFNFLKVAIVNVAIPEFATITALAALAGGAVILWRRR